MKILVAILILFVTGCASTTKKTGPLFDPLDIEALGPVSVISQMNQDSMKVQFVMPDSNYVNYYDPNGLGMATAGFVNAIGSLIGNGIIWTLKTQKVRELQKPYEEMLADYNARKILNDKLRAELEKSGLTISSFSEGLSKDEFKSKLENLNQEKLLVINTKYAFDPELNFIHVISQLTLYLDELPSKNSRRPKYETIRRSVLVQSARSNSLYTPFSPDKYQEEKAKIIGYYDDRLATAKNVAKKGLRKQLAKKLRILEYNPYSMNEPPKKGPEWNKQQIIEELNRGFSIVSKELPAGLSLNISQEEFASSEQLVPYISLQRADQEKPAFRSKFHPLNDQGKEDISVYLNKSGMKFFIPKGEVLQYPATIKD